MPHWFARMLMLLLIIGIPPFLVLANLYVFLTPQYIDYEYGKPGFPQAELFKDADRRYNSVESLLFVTGDRTLAQFTALGVYNEREIKHMVDVRELITKVKVFQVVDGLVLLIALVALVWQSATRPLAARGLLGGGLLTLALFGAVGLFAVVGFNTFFTAFHRVFFEGDSWLFLTTDSLIQFYPLPFWIDTSFGIVGLTIVEALIVGAIGWWWGRAMGK